MAEKRKSQKEINIVLPGNSVENYRIVPGPEAQMSFVKIEEKDYQKNERETHGHAIVDHQKGLSEEDAFEGTWSEN